MIRRGLSRKKAKNFRKTEALEDGIRFYLTLNP